MTENKIIESLISMLPIILFIKLSINEDILSDPNWASTENDYDKKCREELIDENKLLKQIIKTLKNNI